MPPRALAACRVLPRCRYVNNLEIVLRRRTLSQLLREYSKILSNLQIYLSVHASGIVHTSVDVDTIPYKYQRLPKEPRFFFVFFP